MQICLLRIATWFKTHMDTLWRANEARHVSMARSGCKCMPASGSAHLATHQTMHLTVV
jgi:hypothetical protein